MVLNGRYCKEGWLPHEDTLPTCAGLQGWSGGIVTWFCDNVFSILCPSNPVCDGVSVPTLVALGSQWKLPSWIATSPCSTWTGLTCDTNNNVIAMWALSNIMEHIHQLCQLRDSVPFFIFCHWHGHPILGSISSQHACIMHQASHIVVFDSLNDVQFGPVRVCRNLSSMGHQGQMPQNLTTLSSLTSLWEPFEICIPQYILSSKFDETRWAILDH